LDIRKKVFLERAVRYWHRLCMEVVDSLPLEVFRNHGDVALRDVVIGHGGDGLGLNVKILEVFSNLKVSVILFRDMG